jgi:hypothetical protein
MSSAKKHDRKLGLLGVSLTKARPPRHSFDVSTEIQDEIESLIISSGYLDDAPFEWVTVALRYGLKNEEKPHYQRINKKYGDLPLAIELDTHELIEADRDELKRLFTLATLKALIQAGKKYKLPIGSFAELLEELSTAG